MMTDDTLTWSTTRADITRLFGEPPGPLLEDPIITAFQTSPETVIRIANDVATALNSGQIHSGWPILRARLDKANRPLRDVTVQKPDERAKKIRLAEHLIRNTGHEIPNEVELLDEIFGDRGLLKDWPNDTQLRERITRLWETLRLTETHT